MSYIRLLSLLFPSPLLPSSSPPPPEIRLGLNEDLIIGKQEKRHGYGSVVLDDCNFHESANLDLFESDRTLSIAAPDGEVGEIDVM